MVDLVNVILDERFGDEADMQNILDTYDGHILLEETFL